MSVVPEPYKWDTIPDMAGTLVYERKNKLCKGDVLSLFLFHKNYIGMEWDSQDKSVLFPAARCHRRYLNVEILICCIYAGDRNFNLLADTGIFEINADLER